MDSRGSSILGRASSSEDSTDDYNRSQSYQNHFFDALRKQPETMGNTLHEVKEDETTAKNTTNIYYRVPQSSSSSQDTKESDNEDVVYIESTECLKNNNGVEASDNPFRFGGNIDNTRHTSTSETARTTETTKQKVPQDNTSTTINTITNLLKQLQELTDKENELLKKREEESTKDNDNNRRSMSECRRKSRPQIIMKKMKCMLSTSSLGMKNDNSSVQKSSGVPQKDTENNQVSDSSRNSLNSLRLDKLQIARQTLSVVDGLRGNISGHMPGVVRRRAQKCSSVSPNPSINGLSSDDELPLLLGRCFNLSVNLKILRQCNFADPAIGCRVFVDFDVLENYLRQKVQECEVELNIPQTNTEENPLSPKQLETKIHSLTIKNHNIYQNHGGCL
jgi:ElaB/YqjD/DUF883 family membrane-anchored ribosome-binding protein